MAAPTIVTINHSLSRNEVRRRIIKGVDRLAVRIPGDASINHQWVDPDHIELVVKTFGAQILCSAQIADNHLLVTLWLPFTLSMMSKPIASAIQNKGLRYLS